MTISRSSALDEETESSRGVDGSDWVFMRRHMCSMFTRQIYKYEKIINSQNDDEDKTCCKTCCKSAVMNCICCDVAMTTKLCRVGYNLIINSISGLFFSYCCIEQYLFRS